MDLDDGITLRAADDPAIKNELRRAWIADRLDERLGEFGETHAVDVVCGILGKFLTVENSFVDSSTDQSIAALVKANPTALDVVYVLKRQGRTLYGFGG